MRQFVNDTIIIILFIAIIGGSIYCYGIDYTQTTNNLYKQHYIEQHGKEISTLLLGHSQAAHGINPWNLGDSVFDMAEPSRIPYYDKEILLRNIKYLPNLKTVIYPLNYHLSPWKCYYSKESCEQLANEYIHSMGINPPQEFIIQPFGTTLRRLFSFKNYINKIDCDSLGYISLGDIFNDGLDFLVVPVEEDSIIDILCQMGETCKENGIRFVIISTPCNNTFNTQIVDTIGLNRISRIIDSVRNKYPVEYHDYLNHPDFRNDSLYYGQTHLNHKGATLFAQRIKEDIGL